MNHPPPPESEPAAPRVVVANRQDLTVDVSGLAALAAGVLAAAETSITRMNRVRAYHLRDEGRRGARAVVRIAESPAEYLNVVLLLTLFVLLGGTTLATVVAIRHLHQIGEWVATGAMTI